MLNYLQSIMNKSRSLLVLAFIFVLLISLCVVLVQRIFFPDPEVTPKYVALTIEKIIYEHTGELISFPINANDTEYYYLYSKSLPHRHQVRFFLKFPSSIDRYTGEVVFYTSNDKEFYDLYYLEANGKVYIDRLEPLSSTEIAEHISGD